MVKVISYILSISIVLAGVCFGYDGSTTASVVMAGGIIKAKQSQTVDKKYKRKDCPVCKGKGWYMSGDDIKKIECQYCEPSTELTHEQIVPKPSRVIRR